MTTLTPARLAKLEVELGELVASRRRTTSDRRNFTKYARDPVGFIKNVLDGDKLWAKQVEIAEAVRDDPLVAVRSCNSAGKDWLAARLALWWVYAVGGRVLLTGPTDRQVIEILMRKEIARAWRHAKLPGELYTNALRRTGDEADILAMTSTDVGKLTGFHGEKVLVIITEAQDVEDFAFEAAFANATGEDDRVLAVANPLRPLGYFYIASRPGSQWRKIKIPATAHPNVVHGKEVIKGAVTRAWIERQRREYGVGSPIYIARVEGEFPESAEDALVTRAWLERAAEHHEKGTFTDEARAHGYSAGVDVARFGGDRSALALRRGPVLESITTWRGADTMRTTGRVARILRDKHLAPRADQNPLLASPDPEFGPGIASADVMIVVDSTGLGVGVPDRLSELGWSVADYYGSAKPRDPAKFLNRRAESYWLLRSMLEAGTIALPRDEGLFEELLATRYIIGSNGKIQIEGKKELKSRLGRSPDKSDAVVYAFASADEASGFGMMVDL